MDRTTDVRVRLQLSHLAQSKAKAPNSYAVAARPHDRRPAFINNDRCGGPARPMSTYDENVRSYESFARGSLESSPGTVEELPLSREEPATPPRTPPPTQKTTPNTPGFGETASTLALRRSSAASAAPALIKLIEGTDLTFGRGPRADVALVDAARRTAGRRQFVSRRHARVRTATRWGEAVAVLKAFRRRDGRARCGVFI